MNAETYSILRKPGNFSRRRFISSCAACGACFALSPLTFGSPVLVSGNAKMKIRVLYSLHTEVQDRPDWPNSGFDFRPAMEQTNVLLKKKFPSVEFLPAMATGKEEAEKLIHQDAAENIDGYIVFQMNCWNRVVQTVAGTGKPVLYVDFAYGGSGGFLVYNAAFLRENKTNVGFVSSPREKDLLAAVKCFEMVGTTGNPADFAGLVSQTRYKHTPSAKRILCRLDEFESLPAEECRRRLEGSRILAVRDDNARLAEPIMGIPLEYIPFTEVNAAWAAADQDEAYLVAERWKQNSLGVIDVSFDELRNSAAMYLGMKAVLKEHSANAISVNCLGGFYGNHIHAYPCLGFHELNNEGLIGACECDIDSTATMVAFTTMTQGRPGIISDPVIDTSKRQIIYAHCVAPNRMFGPKGPTNPYYIMNHSEDRQGAAVRSILPLGFITTTLKINQNRKEIIFHQAKSVDNDPDDRACRTKLCAEPLGDIEKLFTQWDQWGWHRVTFYGDLRKPVYELADLMGWKVVEEA